MLAGRASWLCHGTMPPGCTTSLRMRILRPANPLPIGARSIDEMTVSVTPDGAVGPGLVTSVPVLPAGQSAAYAPAETANWVKPATAAAVNNRASIVPILQSPFD